MKGHKGKNKNIVIAAAVILSTSAFLTAALWQGLTVTRYVEVTDKVKKPVRLLMLSDLHGMVFGKDQSGLINLIDQNRPDIIMLCGDIADDKNNNAGARLLLENIGKRYLCFYVTGNHECYHPDGEQKIKDMVASYGVHVLTGGSEVVEVNGQKVRVCGVDDPDRFLDPNTGRTDGWEDLLEAAKPKQDDGLYNILLSHRPERAEQYKNCGFDLVLCGHTHGGQVRLPFINGLYAPHQGFFPEYAGGSYDLDGTRMIIGRGLQKIAVPRVFNPPEVVVVALRPVDENG